MHPSRHRLILLAASTAAAVVVGTVGTVVASAAAVGCRVDYQVTNQWQGGFGANVTVTNLGDPVNGWALTWSYTGGQQVAQAWNATVTQSGAQVTARNVDYNAAIATNGTAAFGFNASWNGSNPAPATFALNGVTCTGAPPTGEPTTPPPTTPPPTTPPPAGACTATYQITGQWSGGFQADVKVTAGGSPTRGWSVSWNYNNGQQVTSSWNATISTNGTQVTARNVSHNGTLAAGASTTFGFLGSWNGSNPVPLVSCTTTS
ncbi:hypothetical protein FHG89_21585 [Micromonospora orduensis]|uniref:CBM2 domain-containing protein n=2 Tax=Micromonospora orduensis TaxID=1420891 RepID=A0A5C4QHR7_9ACTN|nr:hypothetical protein FHG89_21585 [Micromonospora orduensis]